MPQALRAPGSDRNHGRTLSNLIRASIRPHAPARACARGYAAMGSIYVTIGDHRRADRVPRGAGPGGGDARGALGPAPPVGGARDPDVVAAGLACFAVWRTVQTFTGRGGVIARAGWAITAIGYGALAWTAVGLLLRFPRGEPFERIGVGTLLPYPAGRFVLRLAAAILLVTGIVAVVQGASGRLPRWLAAAGFLRPARRFVWRAARIGLAARGIVAIVMGYLLLRAVADFDPREAARDRRVLARPLAIAGRPAPHGRRGPGPHLLRRRDVGRRPLPPPRVANEEPSVILRSEATKDLPRLGRADPSLRSG